MSLRSIARGLALAAGLIGAAAPPGAVTRTVCSATGRAAIAWTAHDGCALATATDRPSCCDHGGDRPEDPVEDDCCERSPALTQSAPPPADDETPRDPSQVRWEPQAAPSMPLPPAVPCVAPPATGPPDHATRRHLSARRVEVLTI